MKKAITLFLIAVIFTVAAAAYSNGQRVISVDTPIYKEMENLYILSGRSLPSSSGPWSENEMILMLQRIDYNSLSDSAKSAYDALEKKLVSTPKIKYEENLGLSFGLEANLEGYVHTNKDITTDESDWFHGFTSRKPFLLGSFEAWPLDYFYGYFELSMGHNYGYNVGTDRNLLYKNIVNINIPILNAFLFSNELDKDGNKHPLADFDWTVPYKSLVSAGGNHWNITMGRDRLSWGSGESGNMMLSSSFPKQTFARFTTYFEKFKYSILFASYPSPDAVESQYESLSGYKTLVAHRLEFNLFSNKVGFVVNEACMYWATKGKPAFSLMQINPFGFMHNEYVAGNGNSLLVFEANYTPIKGVNIYGQFAIDEFSGPGEGRTNPQALGFLLGAKGAMTLEKGILNGSIEFAKTDPFLFIRGLHYQTEPTKGYGYDAKLRIISCDRVTIQNKFVTYTYGNDVILLDAKLSYTVPEVFKLGFEAMFLEHGSMSADSYWSMYRGQYDNAPDVKTPTTFNPFDTGDYDPETDTVLTEHAVEKTVVLSLTGEYNILSSLSVYGVVDCLIMRNHNNVEGNNGVDFQFTLGMSYSL